MAKNVFGEPLLLCGKEGDRWCLCAGRWLEAYQAGVAPKIILEATNEKTLEYISLEALVHYAFR
ncbi:MAG: DUF2237 family protein [Anditalea sp.]